MNPTLVTVDVFRTCNMLNRRPCLIKDILGLLGHRMICQGFVSNKVGFVHDFGPLGLHKLVHDNKLIIVTWKIGTLTRKSIHLVDSLIRNRINIDFGQETKWLGENPKGTGRTSLIHWYRSIVKD